MPHRVLAPASDHVGMQRIVAISLKPKAVSKARFLRELILGGGLDEVQKPAVGFRQLPQDVRRRQTSFLGCDLSIEGVNAPVPRRIAWRAPAREDER